MPKSILAVNAKLEELMTLVIKTKIEQSDINAMKIKHHKYSGYWNGQYKLLFYSMIISDNNKEKLNNTLKQNNIAFKWL
jgi:hypothetical protein